MLDIEQVEELEAHMSELLERVGAVEILQALSSAVMAKRHDFPGDGDDQWEKAEAWMDTYVCSSGEIDACVEVVSEHLEELAVAMAS